MTTYIEYQTNNVNKKLSTYMGTIPATQNTAPICVTWNYVRENSKNEGNFSLSGKEFGVRYILGVRMRKVKEVGQEVLSRGGRYHQVYGAKKRSKDPAPLKVKEVFVGEKRYIVCHNEDQARKDRQDREAIVASLRERLKQHGDKSLVGNNGYRKFLKTAGKRFEVNEAKVRMEERFDGKWVLETNMKMSAEEVALRYKELWMVESVFRSLKSVVRVRPVYHKCDETIRGHLFCSFLALCLLKQLEGKMEQRGWSVQWERLRHDLQALEEITVESRAESFVIRSRTCGDAGKALQAVGVALGPAVRLREDETGVN
jgi:transposase